MPTFRPRTTLPLLLLVALAAPRPGLADDPATAPDHVSFDAQVRPILQANCQGCHQPSKAGGGFVLTEFARLLKGGETGLPAVVPGKPEESLLLDQITPGADGKALMPKDHPPLSTVEIEQISRWIAQGAQDDTPANAVVRFDQDHPPVYRRPPVVGALDFSPDGMLLAVGGFHEVLLWKADGSELLARLVGMSDRIESLAFSPDGRFLAVTGGRPARMGEVQVWDVAGRKLVLSVPVTYDTLYGASWSPDGTTIAFGCGDKSVRAIDAQTGEQVLFMGSHDDWALDTVFSHDGSHVISVGRDMTVKLTELATQRFVDNITSITPGALKGGILAVARHPERDEIVIGGSDGVPKLYRVFRQVARVIGDDSNVIRVFEPMRGRVTTVDVSADGRRIAAGSSLDGAGEVHVYSYEFDTALPDDVKAVMAKVSTSRSAEENAKLEAYTKQGVKLVTKLDLPRTAVYRVAFQPDGRTLAVAGGDGVVRLIDPETGAVRHEFAAAPVTGQADSAAAEVALLLPRPEEAFETEILPAGTEIAALEVQPAEVNFSNKFEYVQLLVTATLASGERVDVTRMVGPSLSADLVSLSPTGLLTPKADGRATLTLRLAGRSVEVPIKVAGLTAPYRADFVHDVAPAISRMGCNAGTCHGAAAGKNGFKLSLRGYDPIFDVRALTDDHASRRVNLASPDDSLMLLKPTGAVPHVGGVLTRPGAPNYELIRGWIAEGATLDLASPKVAKIELSPTNPVVQQLGARQQVRVLATYADGEVRDVTREAFVESGNTEVATAGKTGVMTAVRRGEAPILARFEGAYAATTLTVMGDRSGFAWQAPPTWNRVDELTAAKWQRLKILPSGLCDDAEFLRRAMLDLTGLPPSADDLRAFLADSRDPQVKRSELVDRLIGSPEFVDYWTNKWADLLQVNRKFLGVEGSVAFRAWIRQQVEANVPYDDFVRSILTASGSNQANPPASYFKTLREPDLTMENTTQLFLGIRFNCNKCHDHPFERWTQDQYYQTAAYFARVGLKPDPESKGRTIGGTAVEGAKPLFEDIYDKTEGEVIHLRTSKVADPEFPFGCDYSAPTDATRRQELAAWMTSADNAYFARSYVNRLWGYLNGVGIIEPLDDIRAGNPPTNPELLDYLTSEFLASGFDARHVIRLIATSRTYGLSIATHRWNEDDRTNFSHATARRLPAEVLYDAVHKVVGSESNIPGVPPGTRAAALPDSGVELPSGFLDTFGRPARESSCECERSSGLQLGPVMALVTGPTLADAIADPKNELTRLVGREAEDAGLVDELFMRILNRPATDAEVQACLATLGEIEGDHRALAEMLGAAEIDFALKRPQLEREREAAVAAAQEALAKYEAELAPKLADLNRQRDERIAAAEKALNDHDAGPLAQKVAEWEKAQSTAVRWVTLDPTALEATNGSTLTTLPDGSIFVEGENKNGVVTIVARTDLTDVTGLRLEVLADDRLPHHGPGRADDGNFVLNEFEVHAAPSSAPDQAKPVKLVNPLADFNQANLDIAQAIDGKAGDASNGWAVHPATGVVHWATFETAEPLGAEGGTVLTIKLHHVYKNTWTLGRFRLALTRVPKPIGLGLPEPLRAILATAPEVRTPSQTEALLAYHKAVDPDRRAKVEALNAAKAPVPPDARLGVLKAELEQAKQPVAVPSRLAQLRQDVDQSVRQAASRRLTAAQDIAWALLNSPAFLFNH